MPTWSPAFVLIIRFFLFFPSMQWLRMSFRFSAVGFPTPSVGTNTISGIFRCYCSEQWEERLFSQRRQWFGWLQGTEKRVMLGGYLLCGRGSKGKGLSVEEDRLAQEIINQAAPLPQTELTRPFADDCFPLSDAVASLARSEPLSAAWTACWGESICHTQHYLVSQRSWQPASNHRISE